MQYRSGPAARRLGRPLPAPIQRQQRLTLLGFAGPRPPLEALPPRAESPGSHAARKRSVSVRRRIVPLRSCGSSSPWGARRSFANVRVVTMTRRPLGEMLSTLRPRAGRRRTDRRGRRLRRPHPVDSVAARGGAVASPHDNAASQWDDGHDWLAAAEGKPGLQQPQPICMSSTDASGWSWRWWSSLAWGTAATLLTPKVYTASTTIEIDREDNHAAVVGNLDSDQFAQGLRSRRFNGRGNSSRPSTAC